MDQPMWAISYLGEKMGNMPTPGVLSDQARKSPTLKDVMEFYHVILTENARETVLHGHCPLPTHVRRGGKSFRIRISETGEMLRWRCLSESCCAARHSTGSDIVAFVAAMEKCSLADAELILSGLPVGPLALAAEA